jgi:hypothetical protein
MQWQMAIALGVVLVAASAAQAQRQGGRRGFRGGDPMLSVLRIDEVLKEVEVTDEQKTEIPRFSTKPAASAPISAACVI